MLSLRFDPIATRLAVARCSDNSFVLESVLALGQVRELSPLCWSKIVRREVRILALLEKSGVLLHVALDLCVPWNNMTATSHMIWVLVLLISNKLLFIMTQHGLSLRIGDEFIACDLAHLILAAKLDDGVIVLLHTRVHALVETAYLLLLALGRHCSVVASCVLNVVHLLLFQN